MKAMPGEKTPSNAWRPKRRWTRFLLSGLIRFLFAVLTRLRIEGRENLPDKGPLLVVANHFHFADPVALIRAMPWPLDFVGGFQLPNAPKWIRWMPRLWGLHRVRRHGSSRGALGEAEATLTTGGILGIFPEGGSWTDVLRPARPGTAFLAARTHALVVPVGLDGMNDIFPALGRGRRAAVTIRIGKPLGPFPRVERGRMGRGRIDEIGETVMRAIGDLLPEERRGVFSDDPEIRKAAAAVAAYPWERGRGAREMDPTDVQ